MRLHKEFYTAVKKHIEPCVRVKVECEYKECGKETMTFWVWKENDILAHATVIVCNTKNYREIILKAAEACIKQWKLK